MGGKIERRRFLKYSLLTSAALLTGPNRLARAGALDNSRVVVIGAGCSGLSAARTLADSGASVTVIEAKPHIGGRLLTDWSLGAPFEIGAGWIHGPDAENPSRQLADSVGGKYVVTDDENLMVYNSKGEKLSEDALKEIDENWADALDQLDNALESHDSRSLRDALSGRLGEEGFEWAMSAYTEFSTGGPIEDLSAVLHDDGKAFGSPDVVVTTGYDAILKPLAYGLDIKYSTIVSAIQYSDRGVIVKTSDGDFDADYVICSVPLGVLKAGSVIFEPPLPNSYRESIDEIGFGSVTKIAFKFDKAFWDTGTQYFGILTQPKGRWNYWMNYRTFTDQNIILGISVGAYAEVADKLSDTEIAKDAFEVLRGVWKGNVGEPTQMLRTSWSTDPYSLGAYAYPTPGLKKSQFDRLSEPIEDRLLLCGEHTIFDYAGTTHGAYMSGLRAAELILNQKS